MARGETGDDPLARLGAAVAGGPPLPALDAAAYARAHGPFEARSDQRARIVRWLAATTAELLPGGAPRSVLSLGTGDGSVDAPLAAALGRGGRRLRWLAVEPDARVGRVCVERLGAAGVADVAFHAGPFATLAGTAGDERFDLVIAVHSLYYVPDLPGALAAARDRVADGGALVVLLAPLEGMCRLTHLLAPRPDGVRQWWSGDLLAALGSAGARVEVTRLEGRLDVTDCFDARSSVGARVLDFLVQARCAGLPAGTRALLLAALAALAALADPADPAERDGDGRSGRRRVLAHPVDAVVWRRETAPS